ncbi:hypothetical protein OE88DRAFT_1625780 [Heliocybe sulcata]|uniref:ATP-dependent DNA helicase n=1 Tax=Heliocybe sulcata TaxID=5364 RepID=A0A5C3N6E8_9AGAM|nr:hypothetical protein OE88DRAFT_1625780 [Heliocybe sulcata]
MLGCHDLYRICAQLCQIVGNPDDPFGGINMIFCGDFAQLPPAMSQAALYSPNIGTAVNPRMTLRAQETALGKAIWHQFTTVVILRENMRQTTLTPDDRKLRKALENMRYKACTIEDIEFLRTRIAGKGPNRPKIADKRFRHVSVITARNMYRDKINQLGCLQYAADTNQELSHFYSINHWKSSSLLGKRKRQTSDKLHKSDIIDGETQKLLWDLTPENTDHVAGKLSICRGMPILIKRNEATECCITNGAEAKIVSWHSDTIAGVTILDTLFVELINPPKLVQLEGLPTNVVPLIRHTSTVTCKMPNNQTEQINRQQIPILPNFAMTDYASQGRTRPNNVIDLQNCSTHQSFYTCVSRSASTEGTIILQGFDPKKIMGGASGYLRQEF